MKLLKQKDGYLRYACLKCGTPSRSNVCLKCQDNLFFVGKILCYKCEMEKSVKEFSSNGSARLGYAAVCKECMKKCVGQRNKQFKEQLLDLKGKIKARNVKMCLRLIDKLRKLVAEK